MNMLELISVIGFTVTVFMFGYQIGRNSNKK